MRKTKRFDCVQMKRDIQRKLMEDEKGLSWRERNILAGEKTSADPILGPWFQKVMKMQSTRKAEARAEYVTDCEDVNL